jgi:hypothetical protein
MTDTTGERLDRLEDRITDLVAAAGGPKPGFVQRFGTTVFSIGAFLFSILSALFAFYGNVQRDIHDQRTELRSLITQIQELPRRFIELANATQYNAYQRTVLEGLLNKQNVVLASQAGQIATGLAGHVLGPQIASAELLSVANALITSGLTDKAVPLIERALPLVDNFSDYADGYRLLGGTLYARQAWDEGRTAMAAASQVWSRYAPPNPSLRDYQTAFTQVRWAELELVAGAPSACSEAARHAGEAETVLTAMGPGADQTLSQGLTLVRTQIKARCGGG